MGFRLHDLPVYIMVIGVVVFFSYLIIQSNRSGEKEDEPAKDDKKKDAK